MDGRMQGRVDGVVAYEAIRAYLRDALTKAMGVPASLFHGPTNYSGHRFKDRIACPGTALVVRPGTAIAVRRPSSIVHCPLLIAFVLAVAASHADAAPPTAAMQHRNYGGGSCGWASLATGLETKGLPRTAAFVRANYRGKMYFLQCWNAMERFGLEVEVTYKGDATLLETADCAIVTFGNRHAVLFCGYWHGKAVIYNPNRKLVEMCDKAGFISKWKQSGGQAIVIK